MQLLGYVETYGILILYSLLFVGVPALIFGGIFSKFRLCVRIPMYLTISNFYFIFLVQMLQILHICYGPVLWIITLGLVIWGLIKIRGFSPVRAVQMTYYRFQVMASGAVGVKTTILRFFRGIGMTIKRAVLWIKRYLIFNPIETISLIAIAVMLILIFGNDYSTIWGWRASDTPVHAWWINDMIDNEIFTDGIYPFGYHCVVYILYAMFKIPVFIGIKSMGFVSVVFVCITMYASVKSVSKGAASPALGILMYFMWTVMHTAGISRFRAGIPQEYGIVFLMPSVMFLCEFFRLQSSYPAEKKMWKKWDDSKLMVAFMGASVSLTLSVHFYNTIAVVIMLLGAVFGGYLFRIFRPRYFLPIIISGFLGFFIAVLPMGICYATGTPLQGSLEWALGVMGIGDGAGGDEIDSDGLTDPDGTGTGDLTYDTYTRDGQLVFDDIIIESDNAYQVSASDLGTSGGAATADSNGTDSNATGSEASDAETEELSEYEQAISGPFSFKNFIISMKYNVAFNAAYNSKYMDNPNFTWLMLMVSFAPVVFGLIVILMDKERGFALMAFGMASTFMFAEFALCVTGTLSIMDASRSMCFLYPAFFSAVSLSCDGLVQVLLGWFRRKWPMTILSTLFVLAVGFKIYENGSYRLGPLGTDALEPNGAMACTTNIIDSNENFTWTVISAGDELHMVEKYGYHAEIIEMLYVINRINDFSKYTMPTQKVYFYIEKNPLNTGETISKAFAREPLPNTVGQNAYFDHNRTVVMSKFYYWAETFRKQYPNDMYVYYEDDDFICYCLEQNTYSVLNLSIYYGFNELDDADTAEIIKGDDGTWNANDVSGIYQDILNSNKDKENDKNKNKK